MDGHVIVMECRQVTDGNNNKVIFTDKFKLENGVYKQYNPNMDKWQLITGKVGNPNTAISYEIEGNDIRFLTNSKDQHYGFFLRQEIDEKA